MLTCPGFGPRWYILSWKAMKPSIRRSIFCVVAALLLPSPLVALPAPSLPPPADRATSESASPINFHELLHFALLNASVRYETTQAIESQWGRTYDDLSVVWIRKTNNRYLVGTIRSRRVQEIAVRGTTNFRNLLYDLRFQKEYNPRLGIWVHHGFELMALALYRSIKPLLHRDYALRISGQSLGAAEALILAMLLSRDGYHVQRVITFGQPKVTDAQGAARYRSLPLLRVVDQNDPVAYLPPANMIYRSNPYVQFGEEVDLLSGPYYALRRVSDSASPIPNRLVDSLTLSDLSTLLREHNIRTYVRSLRAKLSRAIRVPYSERETYVAPPYRY